MTKEENKIKNAEQYQKHKVKKLANAILWYEIKKDEILVSRKEYQKANKESISARKKEYYQKNKEKIAAKYQANKLTSK